MTTRRTLITLSLLVVSATVSGFFGCGGVALVGFIGANICNTDERCNDGLFCNGEERCIDEFCEDGVPPCDEAVCDEEANTCSAGCTDEACDDGDFCNGEELCSTPMGASGGTCINGTSPCFVGEVCLEDLDRCVECTKDSDCNEGHLCIDDICIEAPTEPESFTVFLRNEDNQNTHLLTASESFGPGNRVGPDGFRTVVMPPSLAGDVFTFRAGREGSVFATLDCEFFPDSVEDAVVTWTGFDLTCTGELTPD